MGEGKILQHIKRLPGVLILIVFADFGEPALVFNVIQGLI